MLNLQDRKALITGGAGGIGSAITKCYIEAGAEVIITGTNEAKLKKLSDELGDKCSYFICDLSNQADIDNLITTHCKDLDILVCNAGITKDNLFIRMSQEEWQSVLNINLTATFNLIKGSIRGMMKKRYGRIINISSVVASTGNPGQANYCASKAGMIGMTKSVALEVASRNITVNCISPGFIETDMTKKLTESQISNITNNIPSKKLGSPDDISMAALYLASDKSSYITGQNININGGLYLN
jgi:3-oxoacyl-[acyl-carrier protein] reductase